MKRYAFVIAILIGAVALFGAVNAVYAQEPTPIPGEGYGPGMMGGWMKGHGMMGGAAGTGAMHEYMQKEMADRLGLSVEALNEMHAEGKTFWQIAEAQGLTAEDAQQLMLDARGAALDAMVSDGVITQEQADLMKTRMGSGRMGGAGGCRGGHMNGENSGTPRGRMMGGRW